MPLRPLRLPAPAAPAAPPEPAADAGPTATFHGDIAFVKRVNRLPTERRVWARIDFATLPNTELGPDASQLTGYNRLYGMVSTLSPQFVIDLSIGALAGSVRRVGQETVGEVPTTHFHANASTDKTTADLHLTDDQKATRKRVFRLLGIYSDVNKADYWVDSAGLVRRSQFVFDQRLFGVHNSVVVTLELATYGQPVQVAPPGADETIKVNRYGRFVLAAIPRV